MCENGDWERINSRPRRKSGDVVCAGRHEIKDVINKEASFSLGFIFSFVDDGIMGDRSEAELLSSKLSQTKGNFLPVLNACLPCCVVVFRIV